MSTHAHYATDLFFHPQIQDWQFGDIIRTTQSVAALKQRRQAKQESKLERQRTSRLVAKARQSARDYKIFTCAEFDEVRSLEQGKD